MTDDFDEAIDYQARETFREPFIGLMTAIGWIAYRDEVRAYEAGFWCFSGWAEEHVEVHAAQRELWAKLQTGDIRANGLDDRGAADIPPLDWRFLTMGDRADKVKGSRSWSRVAVDREALLSLWPPANTSSAATKKQPKNASRPVGRPSVEGGRVLDDMLKAAAGGYDLTADTGDALAAEFKTSRTTALRAREKALSKIKG
jgi:hypothetical protein